MEVYVIAYTDRYEWYDPSISIFTDEEKAKERFRNICEEIIENEWLDIDLDLPDYEDWEIYYTRNSSLDTGDEYVSLSKYKTF